MSTHVAQSWDLPHISDAQALTDRDNPMVEELVAVLKKYNALDRFGIALLHQHFPINKDEVLCETVDAKNRVLTTKPVSKSELEAEPHTVTVWDLRTGRPHMGCVCKDYGDGHSHYSSPE